MPGAIVELQFMLSFCEVQMDAVQIMSTILLIFASSWFGVRAGAHRRDQQNCHDGVVRVRLHPKQSDCEG